MASLELVSDIALMARVRRDDCAAFETLHEEE